MSDLVQKIADAVEVALGDDGHCAVYKSEAVKDAIRQSLAQGGEAVGVLTGVDVASYPDSYTEYSFVPTQREGNPVFMPGSYDVYLHPTPDAGRVAELERLEALQQWNEVHKRRIAALESQLAESREREGRMREALASFTKSEYIRHQHPKRYANAVHALAAEKGEKE